MIRLNDGREELWQWDTGRELTVDAECSAVHFSNRVYGRSVDVPVVDGVAKIPDILLQMDNDLYAWGFVGTPEDGYTKISKVLHINRRNKPADYVFTLPEQTTLDEILGRINAFEQEEPERITTAIEQYITDNPITAADVNAVPQNQGAENAGKFLSINESGEVIPVESGADGITPHIGDNGNWYIGETDTGIKAQGEKGADGITPHIGDNGNWWIGDTDTGVKADASGDYIPLPPTAAVGQYFRVSAVDENGVVTAVEAVDAPSGGGETTDISLGISGAAVGQIAGITAVDDAGTPTAWEAVDMTSGSGEQWELLADYVTEEQVFNDTIPYIVFSQDDNGSPIKCKAVYVEINGIIIRDGSNDIHIRYWFNDVPVWGSYVTDNGSYSVTFCMFAIRSNGMGSAILLDSSKKVGTRSFEYTNIEINTIKIGSNNRNAVFLEPNANIRIYGVRV